MIHRCSSLRLCHLIDLTTNWMSLLRSPTDWTRHFKPKRGSQNLRPSDHHKAEDPSDGQHEHHDSIKVWILLENSDLDLKFTFQTEFPNWETSIELITRSFPHRDAEIKTILKELHNAFVVMTTNNPFYLPGSKLKSKYVRSPKFGPCEFTDRTSQIKIQIARF